ncbi:MAG: hypothetical protein LBC88_10135 [Spirochaetaceae bacterium]|nr:hypothetical protein [Spirochaetaceae bacterium]
MRAPSDGVPKRITLAGLPTSYGGPDEPPGFWGTDGSFGHGAQIKVISFFTGDEVASCFYGMLNGNMTFELQSAGGLDRDWNLPDLA